MGTKREINTSNKDYVKKLGMMATTSHPLYLRPRPVAHWASKLRFSSGTTATIQDSTAPPSVRSLCRLAARSKCRRLALETRDAWKRADSILYAWCLVLTNQSKSGGATPALDRNIKNGRSPLGRCFTANSRRTRDHPSPVLSLTLNKGRLTPHSMPMNSGIASEYN